MTLYVLKIYLHPKGQLRGFKIKEITSNHWGTECEVERSLPPETGCSSMSQHMSRAEAMDRARKELPQRLFNECF